jgi:hypothetical protein
MRAIAPLLVLLAATAAAAEPLPVAKTGVCPSGYASSGSYCTPTSDRAPRAVPKVGVCPGNWSSSGSYCVEPPRRR